MPEIMLIVFCAIFGGIVGSFLNVVVWRLPAGMSISSPGSFCPRCKHPIRFFDNVPVFGWLVLRGKCRDCHEPISIRYPLIEALCAIVPGVVCYSVVVAGWSPGAASSLYWPDMRLWLADMSKSVVAENIAALDTMRDPAWYEHLLGVGVVVTIVWTLCFFYMLTCGLIEYDGKQVPRSLVYTGLVVPCVVVACSWYLWRELAGDYASDLSLLSPLPRAAISTAMGLLVALFSFFFIGRERRPVWTLAVVTTALCFGHGLVTPVGLPLFVVPVIAACLLDRIVGLMFHRSCPTLFLFFASLVTLCCAACF